MGDSVEIIHLIAGGDGGLFEIRLHFIGFIACMIRF